MTPAIVDALLEQWKARARQHVEALDGHGQPSETQFHLRLAAVAWARGERELTLQRRHDADLLRAHVTADLLAEAGPT